MKTFDDTAEKPPARAPRERKTPKKITAQRLENIAVYYLQRYASTEAQLRRVLQRRVAKSAQHHGEDPASHRPLLDALVAKLVRAGLLNDAAVARTKADSLRSAGKSSRVIALKLRQKGVAAPLAAEHVARVSAEISEDEAAHTHARKKRLGPYRATPEARKELRQKDLARLARAGFSYAVAKRVIDEA